MPRPDSPAEKERNQAIVRGLHLNELTAAGHARAAALNEADQQLDRVARVLPDALDAGLSLSEIARVAKVSRQTLYELRARYEESSRNLSLAVLQTVVGRAPIRVSEVAEHLQRPAREVRDLLNSFEDQGFIGSDVDDGPDGPFQVFFAMPAGLHLLEDWSFDEAAAADGVS